MSALEEIGQFFRRLGRGAWWLVRRAPVLLFLWLRANFARVLAIGWLGGMGTFSTTTAIRGVEVWEAGAEERLAEAERERIAKERAANPNVGSIYMPDIDEIEGRKDQKLYELGIGEKPKPPGPIPVDTEPLTVEEVKRRLEMVKMIRGGGGKALSPQEMEGLIAEIKADAAARAELRETSGGDRPASMVVSKKKGGGIRGWIRRNKHHARRALGDTETLKTLAYEFQGTGISELGGGQDEIDAEQERKAAEAYLARDGFVVPKKGESDEDSKAAPSHSVPIAAPSSADSEAPPELDGDDQEVEEDVGEEVDDDTGDETNRAAPDYGYYFDDEGSEGSEDEDYEEIGEEDGQAIARDDDGSSGPVLDAPRGDESDPATADTERGQRPASVTGPRPANDGPPSNSPTDPEAGPSTTAKETVVTRPKKRRTPTPEQTTQRLELKGIGVSALMSIAEGGKRDLAAEAEENRLSKIEIIERRGQSVLLLPAELFRKRRSLRFTDSGEAAVIEVAGLLKGITDVRIHVVGDTRPSKKKSGSSTWSTSVQRAMAVAELLIANGIPEGFIVLLGNQSPLQERIEIRIVETSEDQDE